MHRRDVVRAGSVLGVGSLTGLAGCTAPSNDPAFEGSFEDGMDDWETDAAIGPEVDIEDFEWEIDVTSERAAAGDRSLRIFNEGDHDDGTSWATHQVSVEPGRQYTAEVSAQFWSESESFNTIRHAVARLGPNPPEAEADFPDLGLNTTELGETPSGGLREPLWLTAGWREYTFEWTTPSISTDTLSLSVGTSVIWEGDATHYVDDISVELTPR